MPSNNQIIKLTITLDTNEPPMATAAVMVDATDGSMSYSGTVSVGDDDRGVDILPFSEIMTDADMDSLEVKLAPLPLPDDAADDAEQDPLATELLVRDNAVQLIFVPGGADILTYDFVLTASDENNPADEVDLTITVNVVVTVDQPPTPESDIVEIVVEENTSVCNVKNDDDTLGDCTLAGQVDGGTVYTILSGVDDGDTDYDIDPSTGEISVANEPNYEDDKNPAFIVEITNDDGDRLGVIAVRVTVTDMNEEPTVAAIDGVAWVYETAQVGDPVLTKPPANNAPSPSDPKTVLIVDDPENGTIGFSIKETKQSFTISTGVVAVDHDNDATTPDVMGGLLSVSGELNAEDKGLHEFTVVVSDGSNVVEFPVEVHIINSNESPNFTGPEGADAVTDIDEDMSYSDGPIMFGVNKDIGVFTAEDEDGDDLTFELREGLSRDQFEIAGFNKNADGNFQAELRVKQGVELDYEAEDYDPDNGLRVHVEVQDPAGLSDTLLLVVKLNNVNDESPKFVVQPPATILSVPENTARGFVLANYAAADADGDAINYTITGDDAKSFMISNTGDLLTLESLDADDGTPCGSSGCLINVVASDMPGAASGTPSTRHEGPAIARDIRITVTGVEDSVSTVDVSKANPVPGTNMGNPMSAVAGTKVTASSSQAAYENIVLPSSPPTERPADLPAAYGDAPHNFVETEWGNWTTVLRIEVTAESPDPNCYGGNRCVVVTVKSESAEDELKLAAFRSSTQEDKFVAAVALVELQEYASTYATDEDGKEIKTAIYRHVRNGTAGKTISVPALKVDEEDEVEIEFGNLRSSVDVENEAPEISNFAPEHESAYDDADVEYTLTVTDSNSGLPEPEDLPDTNGNADYMPVVALISGAQCETAEDGSDRAKDLTATFREALNVHEDERLYCPGVNDHEGEYVARDDGSWGFWNIRDDKDFDEIDDGYDIETTIVLLADKRPYYVTFIACDNAGNCTFYDPDGNDDAVELAEITVDTKEPVFIEARTGVAWDDTDNEYTQDRNFIQIIFDDLTELNTETVEIDDFVVEGHSITAVYVYETPDDDDVDWGANDSDEWADKVDGDAKKAFNKYKYRDLENAVFVELEDVLLADETPDVTIVPNGVEDAAGNEQDDGDEEAKDWITPEFTIVSIVAPDTPEGDGNQLAGDDDEVTLTVTSDERLDQTRPEVTVTFVDALKVDTMGTMACKKDAQDTDYSGKRKRGEIIRNITEDESSLCANNDLMTRGDSELRRLNNHIEKVSNTEWIVTVVKPKDTGYYNFYITGKDRSPQENKGSEGVEPTTIVTKFFDSDGDVNVDDAVFWEADINLPKPNVRVSGVTVTDNEASVEFRSPLFVELDFTADHWSGSECEDVSSDDRMANCMNENSEYAEDTYDDVVVTMFELDGVDMTDSVRTTDTQTFLVSLESISLGDHTVKIQAMDQAGNVLEDVLEIDFEVNDRDPFERRLNPGWNLVSLPGQPADSSIDAVFGPGVEVRTVYTYDPVVPGGWMVAVRETLDSAWQGDLTEITGESGYWVLSDAIQDWEVSIPRLAGGAAGTGTPIQPPVIPLYAGWNLIPVSDISGNGQGGNTVSATVYLQSLESGVEAARVLGFDTIRNQWETVLDPDMQMNNTLTLGSAYWIFVREATSLVPSGYIGTAAGD